MYNNFILFISYYFLILFSIIGYGITFLRFFNNKIEANFGYIGLCGIFFLIFYSYLSNLFIPHSKIHNSLFLLAGLIFFIIYIIINFKRLKNEIFLTLIVFSLLIISSLIFKNHDDFPYYHFPYTYYLTQQSSFIGVGQFNHGFRTPSSIFYLNSLFFLPKAEFYLFNFSSIYFLGFANIYFLKKILFFLNEMKNKINKIYINNYTTYLSLFLFAFINIFFYRIGEHGTDRSAQILIFILITLILECFHQNNEKKIDLIFIYCLLGIIISLKAFYILYLIIFIPFFFYIYEKKKKLISTLKYFFINKIFIFLFLLMFFIFGNYFINTGCLIYPVSITCLENFSWSLPITEVNRMNDHYELWSKAGSTPNYTVDNPDYYIVHFNWVGNWIHNYFFNKVSDFLFGILFMVLIFYLIFFFIKKFKNKNKFNFNKYQILIFASIIILTFEWFYNHPALRYGGYCLIAFILFIPSSLILNSFKINLLNFTTFSVIIIIITTSIFLGRNLNRIKNEINIYNYMPLKETFYKIDKHYFRIQDQMENIDRTKFKHIFGKKIFINK
tara:strand:- start:3675 stop:5345 length:1671 start_codon:yes stop_codon:yes gene_type:complete